MTWTLTHSGRDHHLHAPQATHPSNVPTISDIAHSLAHINRFTGHAKRAYSVAEHSLLVMEIARTEFDLDAGGQLAALMHDAHECIVGDVASPVKEALGTVWHAFEAMHEQHLRSAYRLTSLFDRHAVIIKRCDLIALATERRELTNFDPVINKPWPILDTPGQRVHPWPLVSLESAWRAGNTPGDWAELFIDSWHALSFLLMSPGVAEVSA